MNEQRVKFNTYPPIYFFLNSNQDHITPMPEQNPVVYLSRNGGPFARASGSVSEVSDGFYVLSPGFNDVHTVGPLLFSVPALSGNTGYDAVNFRVNVIADNNVGAVFHDRSYIMTFLMISVDNHVSPIDGLIPTVRISKRGQSFSVPVGAVQEIGNDPPHGAAGLGRGWYKILPNSLDADLSGVLLLHAEADGADPTDDEFYIVGTDR